ncbi:MAG: P-II family nitrogen regulator [Treponema sp.]|jgi:nitrogen regulatory protein PII|nr:P-II family nitrogen regulator [Treponema sp.]
MAKKILSKLLPNLTSSKSKTTKPKTKETSVSAAVKPKKPKPPQLKYIFFIVNWNCANIVTDILEEEKVRFYFVGKGMGTATSERLDLLGIGAEEKAIITCLEQDIGAHILMKEVSKKINLANPGTGISFSVPLSAINNPILLIFKQSILKNEKISAVEKKGVDTDMAKKYSHDLIVAIINHGYSDEFMDTAREAGAAGGTILDARGQAHEGAVKFFGVSVQDEKEIILILTNDEKKVDIMRSLSEKHGLNSKTHGIIFSVPVDSVMGLSL